MEKKLTPLQGLEWTVSYIGLPDMQYRKEKVIAKNADDARNIADARLLAEYGRDDFDVIMVYLDDEVNN